MKNLKTKLAALTATPIVMATSAHAALPESVTAALDDLQSDALAVAGLILTAIVAVFAVKFIRRGI